MKKILILGAGLSASSLIKYLLDHADENNWQIIVTARSMEKAKSKLNGHSKGIPKVFDINDMNSLPGLIAEAELVISLLPARFHPLVAKECLKQGKNMFTTSYVSPEMRSMDTDVREKNLFFLNECGVDPGIDHMSAMKVIDEIRENNGKLISFESSTGGLVAPEFDNNPWNYKFTWNPRNVILAGQGVAKYLKDGAFKYIPYHQLFSRTEKISVLDYGEFEVYANRDSLLYQDVYGLENIQTLFRGTLRRPGYCKAYDTFIQLGMTDDTYTIEGSENLTNRSFLNCFLPADNTKSTEEVFCEYLDISHDSEIFSRVKWLGLFEEKPIELENATPAQILQAIIEPKWELGENDLDMIVMQHRFVYEKKGKKFERKSSMVVIGKDQVHTAMSITVGVPLAIASKLFLTGKMSKLKGVHIPVIKEIYTPLLKELEEYGVKFIEEEKEL